MADLHGLIRVRKYAVEQKQKFLSELYRQAEELENQKATLITQRAEEEKKVHEMGVEMLSYFGPYAKAVEERVDDIKQSMSTLSKRIEIAREDMRAAFADLKKIQITQDSRQAQEDATIKKKEDNELDEIALQIFRREREQE